MDRTSGHAMNLARCDSRWALVARDASWEKGGSPTPMLLLRYIPREKVERVYAHTWALDAVR